MGKYEVADGYQKNLFVIPANRYLARALGKAVEIAAHAGEWLCMSRRQLLQDSAIVT
jgi:hypothetical protein